MIYTKIEIGKMLRLNFFKFQEIVTTAHTSCGGGWFRRKQGAVFRCSNFFVLNPGTAVNLADALIFLTNLA